MNANLAQAARGPVVLITLGALMALDQTISFGRTWPALLIVYGLFKLVEHMGKNIQEGRSK